MAKTSIALAAGKTAAPKISDIVDLLAKVTGGKPDVEDNSTAFYQHERAGLVFDLTVVDLGKTVRVEGYIGVSSRVLGNGGYFTNIADDDVWKGMNLYMTGNPTTVMKALKKAVATGMKNLDGYLKDLEADAKDIKILQKRLQKIG